MRLYRGTKKLLVIVFRSNVVDVQATSFIIVQENLNWILISEIDWRSDWTRKKMMVDIKSLMNQGKNSMLNNMQIIVEKQLHLIKLENILSHVLCSSSWISVRYFVWVQANIHLLVETSTVFDDIWRFIE